jgi:hypothetical protein
MAMDDGPIIDRLAEKGHQTTDSLATFFGDDIEFDVMQEKLLDMMARELVMVSEVNPSAWQLTQAGFDEARKRKRT